MALLCSYDSVIHFRALLSHSSQSHLLSKHSLLVPWETLSLPPGDPSSPCHLPASVALCFPLSHELPLQNPSSTLLGNLRVSLQYCYPYTRRQMKVTKLVSKQKACGVWYYSSPKSGSPSQLTSMRGSNPVLSSTRKWDEGVAFPHQHCTPIKHSCHFQLLPCRPPWPPFRSGPASPNSWMGGVSPLQIMLL